MKSPYFTAEHLQFREYTKKFIEQEVIPYVDDWELKRSLPKEIWKKMGKSGLLGLHYPKVLGGSEKDFFYSVILLEELGRIGYAGFRVAIAVHAYMATSYLAYKGSNELKKNYLTPAILGEKISCLAITESEAGSDLNQLQTTATRNGDSYIVNGHKKFVANGTIADFIVAAVKTSSSLINSKHGATGISLLIIDTKIEGVDAKKLNNLGWHCSDTAELRFNNVYVPAKNLIGSENQGFYYIMQCLQLERLVAGLLAIGGIDSCLTLTWQHLARRKLFGSTLSKFQAIRHRMADLVTDFKAAQQLAYYAAWLYEHEELPFAECSMVKLNATELANRVAQECIQFHGAYGYQNENAISRIYRDCQAATIAGGASEIMRDLIAQSVFEEGIFGKTKSCV
jgi:acyl-CoA dehydrogenase